MIHTVCVYIHMHLIQVLHRNPTHTEIEMQILQLAGRSHPTFCEKERWQLMLVSHCYFTVEEKEPLAYLLELGTLLNFN